MYVLLKKKKNKTLIGLANLSIRRALCFWADEITDELARGKKENWSL